jgi:hypothetical protein
MLHSDGATLDRAFRRVDRAMPWCVAALVAIAAVRMAIAPIVDPDVFWIAAAGDRMLRAGEIPHTNAFSFTAPAHPWVMHEWLLGPLFACGFRTAGPRFAALLGVCAGLATSALAWLVLARRGARATWWMLGVLVALGPNLFAPRPSDLTLPLVVGTIALAFTPRWSRATAASLCAVELLWCNVHGSFPLGLGLVFVALFEAADDADRTARALTLVSMGALTLVNPYGLGLHRLVLHYVSGGDATTRSIHARIAEFAPLWRANPPEASVASVAMLALVTLVSALASRTAHYRARAIVVLGCVAMAVLQVRHLGLAVLLGALLLPAPGEPRVVEAHPARARWIVIVAPIALLAWLAFSPRGDAGIAKDLGGADFAALVRGLPSDARVHVPFASSGVVLWLRSRDGVRVFMDPRNDCYPADVMRDAFDLESGALRGERARVALERRGTSWAIERRDGALARSLSGSAQWRPVRTRGEWSVFAR